MDTIQPNKNAVYSIDGEPLPMEVLNKTLEELRQMGFKDVMNFEMKHDPITGGAKPHLPPEEKQRLIKLQEDMQKDIEDPDYHFEGDPFD